MTPDTAYIIFPNTPLAKRVSFSDVQSLLKQGYLQPDTPCIRVGNPTIKTVVQILGEDKNPLDRSTADSMQDSEPLPPLPDTTATANLFRERGLPQSNKHYWAIAGSVLLVGAAAVTAWFLYLKDAVNPSVCQPSNITGKTIVMASSISAAVTTAQKDQPSATEAKLSPEDIRKKRNAERIAAREAALAKMKADRDAQLAAERAEMEKAAKNRAAEMSESEKLYIDQQKAISERDAAGVLEVKRRRQADKLMDWISQNINATQLLNDKIALIYDSAKGSTGLSNGESCTGIIADWQGKRYLFAPISGISAMRAPSVRTLDGKVEVAIEGLPATVFGTADIVGFYIQDTPALTAQEAEAMESMDPAVLGPVRLKSIPLERLSSFNASTQCYAIGANNRSLGQLTAKRITAYSTDDGYWRLRMSDTDDFLGFVLMDYRSLEPIGIVIGTNKDVKTREFLALDITRLNNPQTFDYATFSREMNGLRQSTDITNDFERLSRADVSEPLKETRINNILKSASSKVKIAMTKQTPSLRDTSKTIDQFFIDLASIKKSDTQPEKYTIAPIQAEVNRQIALRDIYFEKAKKSLDEAAFAKAP